MAKSGQFSPDTPSMDPTPPQIDHIYESLPLRCRHDIRLPRLVSSNGELRFKLGPASLDESPEYAAISYCWLDNVPTSYMICNGLNLPITASLKSALL